jgi:allantoin racemase
MSRRILFINPVGTDMFDAPVKEILDVEKMPDTEVDVVSLKRGPQHLEYHYYEALVMMDTLNVIKQGEKDGYDAAVIGCFYDPGLREAREITDRMVVTAPAEACMHIATTLGDKFSVIVGRQKWVPAMKENVYKYGFGDKLASFKPVALGVHDFHRDERETERLLKEAAKEAVEMDKAEVIILGCTIQFGFYKELQEYAGVPVIDAILAPLKYAEFLIEIGQKFGWLHSKRYGLETPPASEIKEWGLAQQYGFGDLWEQKG